MTIQTTVSLVNHGILGSVVLRRLTVVCVSAPTDLSVKKDSSYNTSSSSASSSSSPAAAAAAVAACCGESSMTATDTVSPTRLDAAEVSAIRQLIAGYRESAAFLSRSADELQQLILHQNN